MKPAETFIPSPKQRKVFKWWKDEPVRDFDGLIADGAIRSGKTHSMSFSYVIWAMETFDDENFGICGKTIGSLRRNVVIPLKKLLLRHNYRFRERRSENLLIVYKGERANYFYLFGGRDESSQDLIQGITLAGVFFDEVALMPESFVNQATGRCSVDGSKFWFNCNPEGPYHWFKTEWIDKAQEKNLLYLHFTMEDNPSLTDKIKSRYRSMYVGVFYKRYILGLWAKAEGLIYPMYSDALVDRFDITPEQVVLSIDYGTQNAFAAKKWYLYKGVWYAVSGYYYSGRDTGYQKTDNDYGDDMDVFMAEDIKRREELEKRAPQPKIQTIIDPSAASFIALMKRKHWCKVTPADNDVMDGIRETAVAIQTGLIKVFNDDEPWKMEVSGYVWGKDEAPVKENDHDMDAMRYFVRTKRLVQRKEKYKPLWN